MINSKKGCGIIVLNQDSKILMAQRVKAKKNEVAMQWCIPGGGIEQGEFPKIAVCRELQEESGLVINPENITQIGSIEQILENTLCTDYSFVARMDTRFSNICPIDNPNEMINFEWFSLSDILILASQNNLYPATLITIGSYINYVAHKGLIK